MLDVTGPEHWAGKRLCEPSTPAPSNGTYEVWSDLGVPTTLVAEFSEGEMLPVLPRSFFWLLISGGMETDSAAFQTTVSTR